MNTHTCAPSKTCSCSVAGMEPDEQCPVHGHPWPPTCGICGKFLPWPKEGEKHIILWDDVEELIDDLKSWQSTLGPNEHTEKVIDDFYTKYPHLKQ